MKTTIKLPDGWTGESETITQMRITTPFPEECRAENCFPPQDPKSFLWRVEVATNNGDLAIHHIDGEAETLEFCKELVLLNP